MNKMSVIGHFFLDKIFGRESSLENIPWTLGKFEFGKFICDGSFGEVYLARERSSLYIVHCCTEGDIEDH